MSLPLSEHNTETAVSYNQVLMETFARDVGRGLGIARKRLDCRYFYDYEGSLLFEEICRLPEYYQTRTERSILESNAA